MGRKNSKGRTESFEYKRIEPKVKYVDVRTKLIGLEDGLRIGKSVAWAEWEGYRNLKFI